MEIPSTKVLVYVSISLCYVCHVFYEYTGFLFVIVKLSNIKDARSSFNFVKKIIENLK